MMDYSGQQFCHLKAIRPVDVAKDGKKLMYEFECQKCGKHVTLWMDQVFFYKVRSCGCTKHSDITGGVFSRLTVIGRGKHRTYPNGATHIQYKCRCSCGKEIEVDPGGLTTRHAKSCGCLRVDQATRPLPIWLDREVYRRLSHRLENVKQRCYNPDNWGYPLYGARGVYVCDEWLKDPIAFCKWFLEQPGCSLDMELDRFPDQNGPYAPWNCRLAYRPTQLMNRRVSHIIDVDQHHLTVTQWSIILQDNNTGPIYGYLRRHSLEETKDYLRKRAKKLGVYDLSDREILYRIYGRKALDGGTL